MSPGIATPLSTSGRFIVDAHGRRVRLAGVNWYGAQGTIPVANRHRSDWGDPEPWGLLAPDWRGVANPGVLDLLKSMIPPRTGPGLAEGSGPATP